MIICDVCGAHNARKSVRVLLTFEEMNGEDWYTIPESECGAVRTCLDLCDGCLFVIPEKIAEIIKLKPKDGKP